MPINSNTIVHYTESIDSVMSILNNNFCPKLCLENYDYIIDDKRYHKIALPMVCFCDIPLHLVSTHMDQYGEYGIGLKKSWAERNKINPIQYLRNGSHLLETVRELYACLNWVAKENNTVHAARLIWNYLAYIKPYNSDVENKLFYDECEWRYFPNLFSPTEKMEHIPILLEDEFYSTKRDELNELLKQSALKFEPEDIKYIFVKSEDDIYDMAMAIERINNGRYTAKQVKILISKIICSSYLKDDF